MDTALVLCWMAFISAPASIKVGDYGKWPDDPNFRASGNAGAFWTGLLDPVTTWLLAILFTIWHPLLFWFVPGYLKMRWSEFLGLSVSLFLGAVIFTGLYNSTHGSILIVAIFHGTMDIAFITPSPGNLAMVIDALMTLAGIIILLTHKPTTRFRADKQIFEPAKR